jgi:hypothetical protein
MVIFIYSPEGVVGLGECELDGSSEVGFVANLMKTSSLCRWEIVAQVLKLVDVVLFSYGCHHVHHAPKTLLICSMQYLTSRKVLVSR